MKRFINIGIDKHQLSCRDVYFMCVIALTDPLLSVMINLLIMIKLYLHQFKSRKQVIY
jgi:hypothetical protein